MKKFLVFLLAAFFAPAAATAGSNTSAVYNVSSRIYDEIIGDYEDREDEEVMDSIANKVTVSAGTFNGNITTGLSEYGSASQNELQVNGGTINSKNLKAGVSKKQAAAENKIVLRDVTVQANVVAGEGATDAADNTLTLENATINYDAVTQNQAIAGKGYFGEVKDNKLSITSGSVLDTTAAAGYSEGAGSVSYNTVEVSGDSVIGNTSGSGALYGGYSKEGDVFNNQISLKQAGTVAANLYGGYSNLSVAERNLVAVDHAADITGNIYGGYSAAGTQAYQNEVRLNGGQVSGVVAGGWVETTGSALANKVTAAPGVLFGSEAKIYGGYAADGDASYNQVNLESVSVSKDVYGGYSARGAASNNAVLMTNSAIEGTDGAVAGGYAAEGSAVNNYISITGSQNAVLKSVFGGYGGENAWRNYLSISGGVWNERLSGGFAERGSALGNTLSVSGGTVKDVAGGISAQGEASGNTLILENTTVNSNVYGGYVGASSTETVTNNNLVVLAGTTTVSGTLSGGNGATAQNNTLMLREYTGTLSGPSAFDNIVIYGLDSNVTFSSDVNDVQVVLYGKPSEVAQTLAYTPNASSMVLNRGVLGAYAYTLESAVQGAQTAWSVRGQYQNDLAKPYAQAQLAGLTLAAQGGEMLSKVFDEAVLLNTDEDTFGGVQYYDNSYETGSGFDMQSLAVQGGRWWKKGENVWGLFGQYGHGHYSTDPKDASGDGDDFALGGFALLPYSDEGRFEAVLKAGYQKSDFDSDELSSSLKRDGFFGGLSAGLVQNVSALQIYGKAQWLYMTGDNVHDNLGQSVKFKDVQSLTGRVGARWNLGTLANRYKPYLGVAGIYELDADSDVRVDGHRVSNVDLGGLTGQAEIGVTYENNETLMPMKSSLSVFGLTGQAEGWGANVRLVFSF